MYNIGQQIHITCSINLKMWKPQSSLKKWLSKTNVEY